MPNLTLWSQVVKLFFSHNMYVFYTYSLCICCMPFLVLPMSKAKSFKKLPFLTKLCISMGMVISVLDMHNHCQLIYCCTWFDNPSSKLFEFKLEHNPSSRFVILDLTCSHKQGILCCWQYFLCAINCILIFK